MGKKRERFASPNMLFRSQTKSTFRQTMMQLITLHSQVNADGLLQLQLPDEFKNHTVTVIIRPEKPEWLTVLQETAGTIPDLERPPQGKYSERESL